MKMKKRINSKYVMAGDWVTCPNCGTVYHTLYRTFTCSTCGYLITHR